MDYKEEKIKVMTMNCTSKENLVALLNACVHESRKLPGVLKHIEIYDPSTLVREIKGVRLEERSGSLSCLALFSHNIEGEDVEWVGNEFVHWV